MNPCIAHRGWSSIAPENTISAFKRAMQYPGVEMIELDVQLTKDNQAVIIHDQKLNRTTNGQGYVGQYTVQELKRLDAGSWYSDEFIGEQIPTLEEVLELCKDKIKLNIELKALPGQYVQLEETVASCLQNQKMEKNVFISSFDNHRISKIKEILPEVNVGLVIHTNPFLLVEQLKHSGSSFISVSRHFLHKGMVEQLHKEAIQVMTWTVNSVKEIKQIQQLDHKIGIITDRLEAWQAVKNEHLE